ncbi:MAG: heme ABC transporter ATP-binding protein, partial [Candidatus Syntropharchaeia archaeon]
ILRFKNIFKFCERAIEGYDVKVHSLKASVKTLSGGNIRRLIIARELSSNPILLVAVEPTEGLDFKSVALFRKKLDEIRKKGAVILFSSDFEEISRICDRVLILERGRLEE